MSGVQVPASFVLDRSLTPTAKLVWVACCTVPVQDPTSIPFIELQRRTQLSYRTVVKALDELAGAGWGPRPHVGPAGPDPTVTVPTDLLAEPQVSPRAKLLYALLQLTPAFAHGRGQFHYLGLARLAGASLNTTKDAIHDLAQTGWLQTVQKSQKAPIRFRLADPHADRAQAEMLSARMRLEDSEFRGEAIMHEYLTLLIDSDNYQDRVRPGFLKNPETGELMEFDRFYPPAVAFEFQGDQHFGATERVSAQKAARQQARDLMKRGICQQHGITLIALTGDDLRLDRLRERIGGLLPLRDLTRHGPLLKYLEARGHRYQQEAARGKSRR